MKAGLFKTVTDFGLGKGIRELLDTFGEDWFGLRRVPIDLGYIQ